MMNRSEAIRILDPNTTAEALAEIEYYNGFNGKAAMARAINEACVIAVADMREQEQRKQGCECCKDCKDIYQIRSDFHDSMNMDVYVSGNAMIFDGGCHFCGTAEICFCPKCGRKLTEPPKEGAEG